MKNAIQGAQMLFVAFGALVLVPLLTGLDPSVALFGAGVGTLLFQLITRRSVPIFLASSFAFIAPILYGVQTWGIPATMGGLMAAGFVYVAMGALIKVRGVEIIHKLLPPVVVGPVMMVIGLGLAPVAVNMALGKGGDGAQLVDAQASIIISCASLLTTIALSVFAKGFLKLMPILGGIVVGYALSLGYGIIDFTPVQEAAWFALPNFTFPEFNINAILFMIPVAIAPAVEHVGDMLAISNVTGKNYLKKPGLHRTITGDGVATIAASMVGSGLGFLWFNTYPAEVFMGDVGSLGLGAALGTMAVIIRQEIILCIMGGIFVLEAVSVILQVASYKTRKKRIFKMAPIHHHFELKGWAEPRVIVRFWIITFVLVLIGLSALKLR